MIVKFHAGGKGGGSGPVDYLLGRERNREGATVLQGNPEEVRGTHRCHAICEEIHVGCSVVRGEGAAAGRA